MLIGQEKHEKSAKKLSFTLPDGIRVSMMPRQ
jgi:hypothetical protein